MRKRILNYSILNSSFNYINIIEGVSKVTAVRPEGAEAHSPGPLGSAACLSKNTLGKSIANHNAPCKGKSVNYQCFCPYRAFCYFQSVHPRRCLGLCAFGAFSPFC